MTTNILIIEDNPEMADFIKNFLHDHGYASYISNTGTDGLKMANKIHPELILLDLSLPDIEGNSICKQIKQELPDTKIIIVTAKNSSQDLALSLEFGADDYVYKPIDTTILLARIKARMNQTQPLNKKITCNDLILNQSTYEVTRDKKTISLTAQEYKLLEYMIINKNIVLTREMILSRLWQGNPDIETRVVDVYIGYLRAKIDYKTPHLIKTVRSFGYKLECPS